MYASLLRYLTGQECNYVYIFRQRLPIPPPPKHFVPSRYNTKVVNKVKEKKFILKILEKNILYIERGGLHL